MKLHLQHKTIAPDFFSFQEVFKGLDRVVDFPPFLPGKQHLRLPVRFSAHQSPSEKRSTLKGLPYIHFVESFLLE